LSKKPRDYIYNEASLVYLDKYLSRTKDIRKAVSFSHWNVFKFIYMFMSIRKYGIDTWKFRKMSLMKTNVSLGVKGGSGK